MTVDELKKLNEEIWEHKVHSHPAGPIRWSSEKRSLGVDEMDAVLAATVDHGLVATLANACMGFGVSMTLWEIPSVPCVQPEPIVTVSNRHIGERARFEDGWELFHPIASTEENQRLMKWCGFEPLQDKSYYNY